MTYVEFLKKYWQYIAMAVLLVVGLFVGHSMAPKPTVQIQEKVVEKEVKVTDEQAMRAEVDRRVAEIQKEMDRHTTKVVVVRKDGTRVEKTTTDTHATSQEVKTEVKTVVQTVTKTEYVDRVVEKQVEVKVENPRPDWIFGVQAGANVNSLTSLPNLHVAVEADRRIVGPFYLGLSAGPMLKLPGGSPTSVEVDLNLKATW